MRLSDISIKNPVMAWMIMLSLITFGIISFKQMGISQYPDIDFPMVNVSTTLQGASPEVIEQNVVRPMEDILTSLEGVKGIYSSSRTGRGNISIEFELERSIDAAIQEVSTRIGQVQRRLPKDIDPPIISKQNPEDQPIVWIAVTTKNDDLRSLMKYTEETLKDQFSDLPGVGDIFLSGFVRPIISIELIPAKLKQYNITANDVLDAVQAEHMDTSGGKIDDASSTYNLIVKGEAQNVEDLKKITIAKRAGQYTSDFARKVVLSDLANVSLGLVRDKSISSVNKKTAVSIGIKKQRGSNAVAVAKGVLKKVEQLKKQLPDTYELTVIFDTTKFIKNSIDELNTHLFIAVLLTALVCLMFLGSWSATFNVLLSIPTSIFGAFIVLYFMGYTLNTFTLLGLTLSIGIVVDDAIMVLENIFRHKEHKRGQIQSAIVGAREITFAAIAATAAVIAIFLPVVFMKGVIGRFFMQFGVAISVAVLFSLLESLTITPMRSALYVHEGHRTTRFGIWFEKVFLSIQKWYVGILKPALNHKAVIILSSLFVVGLSFYLLKFIKKEFVPPQESGMLTMSVRLPIGTGFNTTYAMAAKVEDWLLKQPDIDRIQLRIGQDFGGSSDTSRASFMIGLKEKKLRSMKQLALSDFIRDEVKKMTKAKVFLSDPTTRNFGGGGKGFPVEFTLKGSDWNELTTSVQTLMEKMRNSGMMVDVDSDMDEGLPEIQLIPNRDQMNLSGVSVASLGSLVNTMMNGTTVAQYSEGGKRYDIVVSLQKTANEVHDMENIFISNIKGNFLPISKLVKYENATTLQQINHTNRARSVTITANLTGKYSIDPAWDFIQTEVKALNKSGSLMAEKTGTSQTQQETFNSLIFALMLGVLVAYMIIAAQYNSFIDPVTILITLPYSVTGAFLGLAITQQTLNIYSFIGILLLMGIVKKNSILLVDFANQEMKNKKGISAVEAMLNAADSRFRPIVMTSLATITAAIPIALATGEGAEVTRSMAITIIFGVMFSTVLTLVVVPCLYLFFNRFKKQSDVDQQINKAFAEVGSEGL